METIKVNMNPNPLDVQTIHASQNDGEARQWEFELHNNGELIDTSDVKEQLVFKAYKGGTEQLLPENGSTPTTSPFKGDIRYPQGLLSDQEFLYRESPTEEDGLAFVESIKGNTLVWNQNCYSFSALRSNLNSTVNSQTDITCTALSEQTSFGIIIRDNKGYFNFIAGHTYLLSMNISEITVNNFNRISPEATLNPQDSARTTGRYTTICNPTASGPKSILCYLNETTTTSDNFKFNSVQIVDLTMLNDSRITDYDSFKTYYPLSFYGYDSGSLISFNGNGIKTVGFNQWDEEWEVGAYNSADGSKADNVRDRIRNKNPIRIFPSVNYYKNKGLQVYYYDASMNFLGWNSLANQGIFTPPSNACYMNFNGLANSGTTYNNDICINISDPERNGQYEPYTSSTLSLPISTYFPNGMKSAGSVYDELTETKAITRIGTVDMGTLSWSYVSADRRFIAIISDAKSSSSLTVLENIVSAKYENATWENILTQAKDKIIALHYTSNNSYVAVIDNDYTDAPTFKSAMSGVMLYYELATESETSFTTASLVTENAEIPLSNEDGTLIGKCTEQLSENPGFFDAKIKLSDSDGDVYSNKIQLHVERSPQ